MSGRNGTGTQRPAPTAGPTGRPEGTDIGDRLDRVVARRLGVSNSEGRRLVIAGAVRRNGRAERRPGTMVEPGDRIEADPGAVRRPVELAGPLLSEADVLYEDEWLIAVDKRAGLPAHRTVDPARPHLQGALERLLTERGGPAPYVGAHQRLDRDTTGVVLFTKDRGANAAIGALFASGGMTKTYLACCTGAAPPASRWTVQDHLGPIGRRRGVQRYGAVSSGGERAETDFVVRSASAGRSLVEARPRTGRTHQVRVHLAGAGLPIVGDVLYGGQPGPRVLLHAASLAFDHPLTGARVTVTSPTPPDLVAAVGTSGLVAAVGTSARRPAGMSARRPAGAAVRPDSGRRWRSNR